MQFQEITNKQWNMIESHLPKPARTGRPRVNDRIILNRIIYVLIWNANKEGYAFSLESGASL